MTVYIFVLLLKSKDFKYFKIFMFFNDKADLWQGLKWLAINQLVNKQNISFAHFSPDQ